MRVRAGGGWGGGGEKERKGKTTVTSAKKAKNICWSRARLCECSSRVICLWAALPGRGGALLPRRFRRALTGLVLWRPESAFLKPLFIKKWVSRAIRTLGWRHPIKDWALFLLQEKSLWTPHCALQVKTVGILSVWRFQGCPRETRRRTPGSPGWSKGRAANPPWCCRGLEKVARQPALMEAGKISYFSSSFQLLCACTIIISLNNLGC